MGELVIVQLSKDELQQMLDRSAENAITGTVNLSVVDDHLVDRSYLKRNFRWSRRKVENFEREQKLRPEFTGDAKSHLYKLGQCLKLAEKEK